MLKKENSFPCELEILPLVRTAEVDAGGFWPWQHHYSNIIARVYGMTDGVRVNKQGAEQIHSQLHEREHSHTFEFSQVNSCVEEFLLLTAALSDFYFP